MRTLAGAAVLVCGLAASVVAQQPGAGRGSGRDRDRGAETDCANGRFCRPHPSDRARRYPGPHHGLPGTGAVQGRRTRQGGAAALPHREGPVQGRGRTGQGRAGGEQGQKAADGDPVRARRAADEDQRRHSCRARPGADRRPLRRRPDPDRPGQSRYGQDQSRLHRHRRADLRQDRPHHGHEGQCRQPAERHADDDRQRGPDIRSVSGQPARADAGAARTRARPTSPA